MTAESPYRRWKRRADYFWSLSDHAQGPFSMVVAPRAARFCDWRARRNASR